MELINWRNDLHKSIPSLQQKLEKTMGDLSGSDVQASLSPDLYLFTVRVVRERILYFFKFGFIREGEFLINALD